MNFRMARIIDMDKTLKKKFSEWTIDEKIVFLHEVLDHYGTLPRIASNMLSKVKYFPEDRHEYWSKMEEDF
jgi:hypothetical protein